MGDLEDIVVEAQQVSAGSHDHLTWHVSFGQYFYAYKSELQRIELLGLISLASLSEESIIKLSKSIVLLSRVCSHIS